MVRVPVAKQSIGLHRRRRIQSEQSLTVMRKLAIDYVNFIKECWIHASASTVSRPLMPCAEFMASATCSSTRRSSAI
jgi:hypothetical protein